MGGRGNIRFVAPTRRTHSPGWATVAGALDRARDEAHGRRGPRGHAVSGQVITLCHASRRLTPRAEDRHSPFTTLVPNLLAWRSGDYSFVVARLVPASSRRARGAAAGHSSCAAAYRTLALIMRGRPGGRLREPRPLGDYDIIGAGWRCAPTTWRRAPRIVVARTRWTCRAWKVADRLAERVRADSIIVTAGRQQFFRPRRPEALPHQRAAGEGVGNLRPPSPRGSRAARERCASRRRPTRCEHVWEHKRGADKVQGHAAFGGGVLLS